MQYSTPTRVINSTNIKRMPYILNTSKPYVPPGWLPEEASPHGASRPAMHFQLLLASELRAQYGLGFRGYRPSSGLLLLQEAMYWFRKFFRLGGDASKSSNHNLFQLAFARLGQASGWGKPALPPSRRRQATLSIHGFGLPGVKPPDVQKPSVPLSKRRPKNNHRGLFPGLGSP